jgi:predicted transcriptional regulator
MTSVKRPSTAKRSETVTVRLDPKLRYLAEIAARKHRRTLSSYIEWAIEDSLRNVQLDNRSLSMADEAENLWDVDDADRFARLALQHADLLTHDEQIRWKLIRESGAFWLGHYGKFPPHRFIWAVDENSMRFDILRQHWATIVEAAETGDASKMPIWRMTREQPEAKKAPNFDDMEDDIPF